MPATTPGMDWTDQVISTLRILWTEGHSTAEIGRRMGTSKNAIVGKAHRLCLPPRPSPIRSVPQARATPTRRVSPPVPVLPSLLPDRPTAPPSPGATARSDKAPPPGAPTRPAPTPAPEPPPVRPVPPPVSRLANGCQWPIGEPGKAGFHLCGDDTAPGKPYCASHCGRAYVRPRDGVPAAAAP